jgi:hypothetical protein
VNRGVATLTVEGVPDALVARLSREAAGNGRCLNSEVIVHLARAAGLGGQPPCQHNAGHGGGCGAHRGCRCVARRLQPAAVGWGGPACSSGRRP